MPSAIEQLKALFDEARPVDYLFRDLEPLWIEGLEEHIELGIERVPLLRKVANETGVRSISSIADVRPLLFAHTSYKSYPMSFISRGRWDAMNGWLDTVSASRLDNVDTVGVTDQDEWLARLHAAGHKVLATSGTSGKNSFLPNSASDATFSRRTAVNIRWTFGVEPKQDRPIFFLSPKYGPTRATEMYRAIAESYGRPGARHFLSDQPLLLTHMTKLGALRKALGEGAARPSEIVEYEASVARRGAEMRERLDAMIGAIFECREEPVIIGGFWPQFWLFVEAARERGFERAALHPETVLLAGGGTKGAQLPDDYKEQVLSFLGLGTDRMLSGYGMSELSVGMPQLGDRYRIAPWIVPLLLDQTGEHVLNAQDEFVQGRFAFVDLSIEGRWGGLVTGDRVTAHFTSTNHSLVAGSVQRYADLEGGDDKLTCAGTIDAFVRGLL